MIIDGLQTISFMIHSLWGPPVDMEVSQKAEEILDSTDHFMFYWEPISRSSWGSLGGVMSCEDFQGNTLARFFMTDERTAYRGRFWFREDPNKEIRLHWRTQSRLYKIYWKEWTRFLKESRLSTELEEQLESLKEREATKERILKLGDYNA